VVSSSQATSTVCRLTGHCSRPSELATVPGHLQGQPRPGMWDWIQWRPNAGALNAETNSATRLPTRTCATCTIQGSVTMATRSAALEFLKRLPASCTPPSTLERECGPHPPLDWSTTPPSAVLTGERRRAWTTGETEGGIGE